MRSMLLGNLVYDNSVMICQISVHTTSWIKLHLVNSFENRENLFVAKYQFSEQYFSG